MRKITKYCSGAVCWLISAMCYAADFEVLPDLPEAFALAGSPAKASTVTGAVGTAATVGHEPSIISVVFSLLFVVLLIYVTGILYTKLNKTGFKALNNSHAGYEKSRISVLSTTPLGNNKTLHVVELDGKRMLIGAATGAIQLIKDLGAADISESGEEGEEQFSHIEIPNIKIPKIEIPKIEIPSIGFSKIITKAHKDIFKNNNNPSSEEYDSENSVSNKDIEVNKQDKTEDVQETLDIFYSENNKGEYEKSDSELYQASQDILAEDIVKNPHAVDPDEYSLYKKYL